MTVRELLEDVVLQLEAGKLAGQPSVETVVRGTLGQTFRSLSLWDAAELQWRKALELATSASGPRSLDAAGALAGLGQVQLDQRQLDDAERSIQQALAIRRAELSKDDPQIGDTMSLLARLAETRGDLRGAQSLYREALAVYRLRPDEPARTADAMTNVARMMYGLDDRRGAIDMARDAMEIRRRSERARSPEVWNSLINLAAMQEGDDDLVAAEQTRREALALARELVDEKHQMVAQSLSGLGRTLWQRGTPEALAEAEQFHRRAVEIAVALHGERSTDVALRRELLAIVVRDRGDLESAIAQLREILELRKTLQPQDHPDLAGVMSNLAVALTRAGQQPQEAITLAEQAAAIRAKRFPPEHWINFNAMSIVGAARAAAGEFERAEPMLLKGFEGLQSTKAARLFQHQSAERLVMLYEKWGKPEQAAQWKQKRDALATPTTQPH
jgi:tetratricopeptide (TPR) repeat protein